MDPTYIFFIVLISVVGLGYFYTGKKNGNHSFLLAGILMMIFPYIVTNEIAVAILSIVLIIGPFFYRI